MDKIFIKDIEDACDNALVEIGFKRPRRGTRYLEITKDFFGWVGLNKGNHIDCLQINPFIGVHCVPIMRMKTELEEGQYKLGQYATYAIHLGEIIPDVTVFNFQRGNNIEQEARRLSIVIGKYGFPWMKEHANYGALLPLLESRLEMLGGYPQRLAIGYFLAGQLEKARKLISSHDAIFLDKKSSPTSIYQRFTKPFLKMLDEKQ